MLRFIKKYHTTSTMLRKQIQPFGLFNAIMHYLRTALNRVRWEENQQFRSIEQRGSTVPKSAQEATKIFIASQQQVSLSEQDRMKKIDMILGTNTHFHEGKIYQQRIDSDHLMDIQQLQRQNPEQKRQNLDWLNPQADIKIKYKNKRKYYDQISKLRTYPVHNFEKMDLSDQSNQKTIAFLGAQTAYSTISLKPTQITAASLQQQNLFLPPQLPFQTQKYCYFHPNNSLQLLRVTKDSYDAKLLVDENYLMELGAQIEEVISLDQIYQILKEYDTDERVRQYLKKVENNRIDYLFSDLNFDSTQSFVAITIDLLDNGIEHCMLVKSISSPDKHIRPIFNMKPPAVFSSDSKNIYYIQRSAEGGWIELVKRSIQSCWGKSELTLIEQDQGIIYRCSPQKQLQIGKDSYLNFIFLVLKDYGRKYSEQLFIISNREGGINLIEVQQKNKCQYFYDMTSQGLIIARKKQVLKGDLKYGKNEFYIDKIDLVPFKTHVQIHNQNVGLTQLLPGTVQSNIKISPEELDFGKMRCIFSPDQHQFINNVQVKQSHIVMTLNYFSVYDRAILYILPFKESSHPHSLILKGSPQLSLKEINYSHNNQIVEFSQQKGLLSTQKTYNIWKRQLSEGKRQASRYHHETITLNEDSYPFQLHFVCKSMYTDQKLPILFVIKQQGESIDQVVLRQFLQKGVGIIEFCGRGTFTKDLQHFLAGSRHNFTNFLDDLQTAIEFIGNNMTQNISLYCKGQVSSFVGLWFNIYLPYLFNTSVLHNGIYKLDDQQTLSLSSDFFGKKSEDAFLSFDFQKFNIFNCNFRTYHQKILDGRGVKSFQIGQLENIIISSSTKHRLHSRKLIKRLRENRLFNYDQVYLKEYDDSYATDLHNMSYIFYKLKHRMEKEVHSMPQDQEDQ